MNKVIFLDRDGTINSDDHGYISSPDDFHLYPNAAKAIKLLNEMNYKVVVVTNQSGVARGYFTLADVAIINNKMITLLKEEGAFIDDILISPYHPKGVVKPYNIAHEDRKPGVGLLKKYYAINNFKTSHSIVIGDKISDIELGYNFNIKTILVRTGEGNKTFLERNKHSIKADFVVKDLWEATKIIKLLDK